MRMAYKIKWGNILNETRHRVKEPSKKPIKEEHSYEESLINDHRNPFEGDYDRIMSSSSLRRLQDKAQVFPLQDSDFIRTRLTHSMEVSAIARSFGTWLEKWLINVQGQLDKSDSGKIPAMLATAGLVHDIGNPPFGHYGEDVIKRWFDTYFSSNDNYTEQEKNDFKNFDGNAQGIRVLTRLQLLNDQYGINFTYGTLSILLKYPWDSNHKIAKEDGKFGYFKDDEEIARSIINNTTGVPNCRNPLTYLLEAADDIAYLGADVEDGVKKGIIPWEKIFENTIANEESEIFKAYPDSISNLIKKHKIARDNNFPDFLLTSVQNFKVWVQAEMIREVKKAFMKNYDDIMNGDFSPTGELLESAKLLRGFLTNLLKKYCFPNKEVLSLELVGDSVITDLLDIFINDCIMEPIEHEKKHRLKSGKLYKMISNNFIFVHRMNTDPNDPKPVRTINELNAYNKLLLITDFVSGMTDSYAVDLHQKLKGVKMP
ncbi:MULTISPECIES: dGTP triphosphohydrolase [Bacillales]|uniref:dGTP triphosphohydrolase n=1 Tax=Bacillales TaxID=1385 RepID=UPI001CFD8983|nr:dNTP triphosphohydrolase [Pseudalkalibacillus hwajinpoensis]WLR59811.1 dNTP triphosphohydrolase [Pseudalkalibacillus hwajinpoensis]